MNSLPQLLVLASCLGWLAGQEPVAPTIASQGAASETWTEGFARATSYRAALAEALEDAVGKAKGVAVARGAAVRSRLSVVSNYTQELPNSWFDGEAHSEREWVQQQIAGFVQRYEVVKKGKADDGQWEVTVKAQVAALAAGGGLMTIDLADNDLRSWQLDRFEEGVPDAPFAKVAGNYDAPSLRENLRATGVVRVLANSAGVAVGEGAAPSEKEKTGHRLVASHKVVVVWQPMQFQSLVEKPNKARPTTGPRPQFLTAGSVQVAVKVLDLVHDLEVLDRSLTIALDVPSASPVDRLDAFAVQLADMAKAAVAETVFFALVPPVVVRKWPAEPGPGWLVEVAMSRRVAEAYAAFSIGTQGSLASPDWRSLGKAAFVQGTATSCTFRLIDVADPASIEPGVAEVRPAKK